MNDNLPNGVVRCTDTGGREALCLRRGGDEVLVSRLGAQVLSWHRGGRDVLWTASKAEYLPGKPVRGGVPLVFPWFGDHPTDAKLPAHGFVRNLSWRLAAATAEPSITLEVGDDATTRAMWPHPFRLRFEVRLGTALQLALTIENCGATAFSCEHALHTYFGVGAVDTASVHGLEGVTCAEFAKEPEVNWDQRAPLRFRAETDRVFQDVPARIELRAPALARTTTLTTSGARSAIVWNPWPNKTARLAQMAADDWRSFVCIESANVKERAVTLAPGASHTLALTIAAN